jgi:thiol-disulfide isomerase/thioredoxin
MNRKLLLVSPGVLIVLAVGVLYGIGHWPVHDKTVPPRALGALVLEKSVKPAPAVAFADADGGRHMLADFRGHYVLLNMWATWCAPCVSELPALARLSGAVPGLKVLAVDVGRDKASDAAAFLKSHNAAALGTFVDNNITLIRAFGAFGLPTTVLIDPGGNVVGKAVGPAEWSAPDAIAYFRNLVG